MTLALFAALALGAASPAPDRAADVKMHAQTLKTGATIAMRTLAAKRLGELGLAAAPALREALADPAHIVRLEAAASLDHIGAVVPGEVASALAPLLQDADRHTRNRALDLILGMGLLDPKAREVTLGALASAEPEIRLKTVTGLWKSGLRGAEPYADEVLAAVIQRVTDDKDIRVRRVAILGMRSLHPVPTRISEALLATLGDPELAELAAATIDAIPDEALNQAAARRLTESLKDGQTAAIRALAAATLAGLSGMREGAAELLLKALATDPAPEVRAAAARTVGTLPQETSLKPLLSALRTDASPKVKAAACVALSQAHPELLGEELPRVLAALDAATQSPDDALKAAAAMAAAVLRQ